LAKNTNHAAPRYAVFFTLPSLHPSSVQIFSSAPCSQTPSVYVALNVKEHVSHQYRTTDKIIDLYILIVIAIRICECLSKIVTRNEVFKVKNDAYLKGLTIYMVLEDINFTAIISCPQNVSCVPEVIVFASNIRIWNEYQRNT
jgi:hypothetical protein